MFIEPKTLLIFLCFLSSLDINAQNTQQAITIDNLLALKKVSDVQISPDGKWVAYTVLENDLKKDKSLKRVYKIAITGGDPIAITGREFSASQPKWSSDNKYLSFLASK
ncbi:MAG: Tol biopolymer transport system component, partial [Flavobacteriaceae bacterium]